MDCANGQLAAPEQTLLFENPPVAEDLESSEEHRGPRRPEYGRWLSIALVVAALVSVGILAIDSHSEDAKFAADGHRHTDKASTESAGQDQKIAEWDVSFLVERVPVQEFKEVVIDDEEPVWINTGSLAKNASSSMADEPPVVPAPKRRLDACQNQLHRIGEIRAQHLVPHSADGLFPPSMVSIAKAGENCGDSARGIHESCDKYDRWKTFQDVAEIEGKDFHVLTDSSVDWHDIDQGELGTCYFLAALASIAYSDPEVIGEMFVHREKWSQNIFTTRWLVGGKVLDVEVDNNVPARDWGTFFVQPSSTGEWWPVILEKAWSKIAGNYKAAEGGMWRNPVLAITAAPLTRYAHNKMGASELVDALEHATHAGWPMGTSTGRNCVRYGLSRGHAYSVFKVFSMSGYGKVISVYNPWHRDDYHGSIPNEDKSDGVFAMTPEEFHDAFDITCVAEVKSHYKVTTKEIQTVHKDTTAWEFDVPFDGEFDVSISWPIDRMFSECNFEDPDITLIVVKAGDGDHVTKGYHSINGVATVSAKVKRGAGKYTVVAAVKFPDTNAVHEANLVVYAPQTVQIQQSSVHPSELLVSYLGASENGAACHNIFVKGYGNFVLNMDEMVNNVPTYWSPSKSDIIYWAPYPRKWLIIQANYLDKIRGGNLWSFAKVTRHSMSCGCKDDPKGVAGFNGIFCNMVKGDDAVYTNVKCDNTEHSDLVRQYCPVTCNAGFCQSPAPAPVSTPAPTPPPSSDRSHGSRSVQQECKDEQPTHIKLNGKSATCAELKDHCQKASIVKAKCCASCAAMAEEGGMSDDLKCRDHNPPGLMNGRGSHFKSCTELKGACKKHHLVPQRCCATCEAGQNLREQCQDEPDPNLQTRDGRTFPCKGWKRHCHHPAVKEECCATCSR